MIKKEIRIIKPIGSERLGIEKDGKPGVTKYPGCGHTIRPARKNNGEYITGLEILVPNPDYISKESTPKEDTEILLRSYLEKALGVQDLTPRSEFWNDIRIKIEDKSNIFNIDDPWQKLQYYVASADQAVASGEDRASLIRSNKPFAKYFTVDEEREANEISKARKVKYEAIDIIRDATIETKRKFVRALGEIKYADDSVKENVIDKVLDKYVEEAPERIIKLSKDSPVLMNVRDEILLAIDCGIIARFEGSFHRVAVDGKKGAKLDGDIDEIAKFLSVPRNQEMRMDIKEQVRKRKESIV